MQSSTIAEAGRWNYGLVFAVLCAALWNVPLSGAGTGQDDTVRSQHPAGGLMRYPDASATHIVFLYANNLWLVPRDGGVAVPLAGPQGVEMYPRFSPDGEQIAFVGHYGGNSDLYTIPAAGGIPRRVTHHPAYERLCDWTPDGRLIYASNATSFHSRVQQLFTVAIEGGLPECLPIPWGAAAAMAPDGRRVAYTPYSRDHRTWKRYMGGLADDIWLFDLEARTGTQLTDWDGTDSFPMWHGECLFFLSDAGPEHRMNLWSLDLATGTRVQRTFFDQFDVRFPAMGPGPDHAGEIVFQCADRLWLMDLTDFEPHPVEIRVPGDRPRLQPRFVDVSTTLQGWGIGPTGQRVAVQARGDVWTAPVKNGSPRNLTQSAGIAERHPAWSPDGKWVAFFSDASGEYELCLQPADGLGEPRVLTADSDVFCWWPNWSPDSQWIAFGDKSGRLWVSSAETMETRLVLTEPTAWRATDGVDVAWSPDSRMLVVSASHGEERLASLWVYGLETDSLQRLTGGAFHDNRPVFDRAGKYLYFVSNRAFLPTYSDLDTTFVYRQTETLMVAPLHPDAADPFAAETDEERPNEESDKAPAPSKELQARRAWAALLGRWTGSLPEGESRFADVSFEGLFRKGATESAVAGTVCVDATEGQVEGRFDPESGRLDLWVLFPNGLRVACFLDWSEDKLKGVVFAAGEEYAVEATRVAPTEEEAGDEPVFLVAEDFERRVLPLPVARGRFGGLAVNDKDQLIFRRQESADSKVVPGIKLYDPAADKPEEQLVTAEAGDFQCSADGKKLLLVTGSSAKILDTRPGASAETVRTAPMSADIDPRVEWRQLFRDTWRIVRDFFYDPNMHGVDWAGVYAQYAELLDECASREDVQYLIGEMIAELNVGHAYLRSAGMDADSASGTSVGLLGCDYVIEDDAYKFARIFSGAAWDSDARGPLGRPGMDVQEGDYLLAVNGVQVRTDRDPYSYFVGLAGRETTLTVSKHPKLDDDARTVVVVPVSSEGGLRYRHWIEESRRYVDLKSDGRVGYIYVPNTGRDGQNDLVRQLVGQLHKDALIIDERWNGGGQIPTRFIELLNRPVTNYWAVRDGRDWVWPPDAHHGPKCMLINGPAGSGGDAFPYYFRQAGLGTIIGTRTWGGLVGISGNPGLIDGGGVTVPTFAFYEADGTWGIEGYGVDPDIEVPADPTRLAAGTDPQLDAAVEHLLGVLAETPTRHPVRPVYPNRSGMGIPEADR